MIKLKPFPAEDLPIAWAWLQEFPEANFHDDNAATYDEFVKEMDRRAASEIVYEVTLDEQPIGMIGYKQVTKRLGMVNGICFSKEVHGKRLAYRAMQILLDHVFKKGTEKVSAMYFTTNDRVRGLLKKLGFVDEGLLRAHFMQNQKELDAFLVARFRG